MYTGLCNGLIAYYLYSILDWFSSKTQGGLAATCTLIAGVLLAVDAFFECTTKDIDRAMELEDLSKHIRRPILKPNKLKLHHKESSTSKSSAPSVEENLI